MNGMDILSYADINIKKGDKFESFQEAKEKIETESKRCFVQYYVRDSRTISAAKKKTKRYLDMNLSVYQVKFACIHGGRAYVPTGTGLRNKGTFRKEVPCPALILLRADESGKKLVVVKVENEHNHLIHKILFNRLPHQRKLNPELREEAKRLLESKANMRVVQEHLEEKTDKVIMIKDLYNLKQELRKSHQNGLENIPSKIDRFVGTSPHAENSCLNLGYETHRDDQSDVDEVEQKYVIENEAITCVPQFNTNWNETNETETIDHEEEIEVVELEECDNTERVEEVEESGESKTNRGKYEKCCRICLKESRDMYGLFNYLIGTDKVLVVDFLKKITGLGFLESETTFNNICTLCIEKTKDFYNFTQLCIKSDQILRSYETQRLLGKIEEETLTEEDSADYRYYFETSAADDPSSDNNLKKEDDCEIECKNIVTKYVCEVCHANFTNKTKFSQHRKTHEEFPFKCDECNQRFAKAKYLYMHLRYHVKEVEKKFICKICEAHFAYEYLLKQHEFKHSESKPFPCSKCNRGCLTAESLKRHMRIHDENYIKKTHVCAICSKHFEYPSFLAEHMKNHTGERPYLCSVCGKGFRQSGALHFHQRIHTGCKPFKCKFCNEDFRSMSKLKVHMRTHTNERPFVCDICGVAFKQSGDLKSHKTRHDGQRDVLCPICGKAMASTGQLTVHVRTHTGEKPYVCEICSKPFTTKALLVKHNRMHTGEKPYVCDVCGKSFSQSSSLKVHSKIHEKVSRASTRNKKKEGSEENNRSPIPLLQKM